LSFVQVPSSTQLFKFYDNLTSIEAALFWWTW